MRNSLRQILAIHKIEIKELSQLIGHSVEEIVEASNFSCGTEEVREKICRALGACGWSELEVRQYRNMPIGKKKIDVIDDDNPEYRTIIDETEGFRLFKQDEVYYVETVTGLRKRFQTKDKNIAFDIYTQACGETQELGEIA